VRMWAFLAVIALGIPLNIFVYPQVYEQRPPVFRGPDIAANWEWRSMATGEHSWWLWSLFPDAHVSNVGYQPPPNDPNGLAVGILFSSWRNEYLGLDVDDSLPPLDVTNLDIRDDILAEARLYSRIRCRDSQAMKKRDSCYYLVAWNEALMPSGGPHFVAVRTVRDDDSEVALVEQRFLESLISDPLDSLPNYWEVD